MLLMGMGRLRDIQQEACRVMNEKGSDCAEECKGAWEMRQVKAVHEMEAACPVVWKAGQASKVTLMVWKGAWQAEEKEAKCG